MKFKRVLWGLGSVLKFFSIALLAPVLVALLMDDEVSLRTYSVGGAEFQVPETVIIFLLVALATAFLGLLLEALGEEEDMRDREGYAVVALAWVLIALVGAFPYWLSGATPRFLDAYFESMSGFATVGASALAAPLESYPASILFWRSFTEWLGGMGVIVLSVAILSQLTQAGLRLIAAETGGSTARLRPKVAQTARTLWGIYTVLTLLMIAAVVPVLMWRHDFRFGAALYDGTTLVFAAIATGGYSIHTDSVAFYRDWVIELMVIGMMIVGGTSFTLMWRSWVHRDPKEIGRNPEWRFLVLVILLSTLAVAFNIRDLARDPLDALRHALFQTTSMATGTGYGSANYNGWPDAARFVLVVLAVMGPSAGSTGGAVKTIRFLIMFKLLRREVTRLLHPTAVLPVRVGDRVLGGDIIRRVTVFFFTYVTAAMLGTAALAFLGYDIWTAGSASVSALGAVGFGLGDVAGGSFGELSDPAKIICIALMWFGRLEIYTALFLFFPSTYKT